MSSVRVIIQILSDEICPQDIKKILNEILTKKTSFIEEKSNTFVIAEISSSDYDEILKNKNHQFLLMEKVSKIPKKNSLSFNIPPAQFYEVFIPLLTAKHQIKLKELGIKLIERLGYAVIDDARCDKYLFYLNRDQVQLIYQLPFVHSIIPYTKTYDRNRLLELIREEKSARIACQYAPHTKSDIKTFLESWPIHKAKPLQTFFNKGISYFSAQVTANHIEFVDELAKLSNVMDMEVQGRPQLFAKK